MWQQSNQPPQPRKASRKQAAAQVQARFSQAFALQQRGQLAQAEALYQQVLELQPQHFDALHFLGIISLQTKQLQRAVELIGNAIRINPRNAAAYNNRGIALHGLNRLDEALASCERAIFLKPNYAEAYYNRGNALRDLKRFDEALASYDRAIVLKPDYADPYINRGVVLKNLNRLDEALASYNHAIALKPDDAQAYYDRGIALQDRKRLDEALASYDRAIALKPDYADAHFNRGNALQDLKRLDEALVSYDRAIALKPGYADAYNNRGNALRDLKRLDEALANYDYAIGLTPGYTDAYVNRGNALRYLNRLEESLASYEHAIALRPDYADAYFNRGIAFQDLNRLDEALASCERAISLKPDFAGAYWHKSLLKILAGDYEEGWRLYEWRWRDFQEAFVRNFTQPLWLGDKSVAGKTLLIHAEQGLGDIIQFCRYVLMVEALGAKTVLEVPSSLVSLISTLKSNCTIVEQGKPLPTFDLHCPIMSLPLAFKTTVASIPATVPYLYAHQDRQMIWHQRLGNRTRTRVGFAWSGSTDHKNDHRRSIPLQVLEPLLQLPIEFHALQKDIRASDAAVLSNFRQIQSHHDELHDFSDTAALIQEMDVVIAVDTAVAHLAGALGQAVWILLPFAPDYRWMLERTDSPWYPTATLFRQPAIGDWSGVMSEVTQRLRTVSVT